jgi:signal transduction histidine kinase
MHESGEALRALLNENFDLSDIESGSMQLAPRPTDIRKLIARPVAI